MTPLTIWQNVGRLSPLELPTQRRAFRIRDAIGKVVAIIDTSHIWGGSELAHASRILQAAPKASSRIWGAGCPLPTEWVQGF
jgi:hypothetical protein